MYSIGSAYRTPAGWPTEPSGGTHVGAGVAPTGATGHPGAACDLAATGAEVARTLRGTDPVDSRLLDVTLSLIPTLDAWPAELEIELQHDDGTPGSRHGRQRTSMGDPEPIHVRRDWNGCFATAHRGDAAPWDWLDCGAHSESVFEAVLEGLHFRDGVQHWHFTSWLGQGATTRETDALALRRRLAQHVEQGHPDAMLALQGMLEANGPQAVQPEVVGEEGKVTIDAPLLRRILDEARSNPMQRGELARKFNVSPNRLRVLVDGQLNRTAMGENMLRQEGRTAPYAPLKREVLQTIIGMVNDGRIATDFDLLDEAGRRNLSYNFLQRLVSPGYGKTAEGTRFLDDGFKRSAEVNAARRARHARALPGTTRVVHEPVTADMLLEIHQGGLAKLKSAGGVARLAITLRVSPDTLKKSVLARTCELTKLGKQTVWKKYPDYRFDDAPVPSPTHTAPLPADPLAELMDIRQFLPASPGVDYNLGGTDDLLDEYLPPPPIDPSPTSPDPLADLMDIPDDELPPNGAATFAGRPWLDP